MHVFISGKTEDSKSSATQGHKVKVRWTVSEDKPGYTEEEINRLFYKVLETLSNRVSSFVSSLKSVMFVIYVYDIIYLCTFYLCSRFCMANA